MKNKWLVWAIVAVAVVGIGYLALRPASGGEGIVTVGSAEVEKLLASDDAPRVVDVRTAQEFDAGHLRNAESVPVDQVQAAAQSWDRAQPLLVYCATGARSSSAVQQLQSMGFETIYHFDEGLVAWQGPLDSGASQPVAQAPAPKPGGTPVMYEFFTDW